MNQEELLDALEEEHEHFLESIDGLSDEELEEPGVYLDWSIKDIVAHITMWEGELIKLLWQARQGEKPTTVHFSSSTEAEISREWAAQAKDRDLERVFDDFESVRRQTIRRVEGFKNKDLTDANRYPWLKGKPLFEWIAQYSFRHEAEHIRQILSWREKLAADGS